MMQLTDLLSGPQYRLAQPDKERVLLTELTRLTEHHRMRCSEYARMLELHGAEASFANLASIPYVPVGIFKTHRLASVPAAEIFKTMVSSGTSGQGASQIVLDRVTAQRQAQALAGIMGHILGPERLPMLIVDGPGVIRQRPLSARGAGVLGMMSLGRQHLFALDDDMNLDRPRVDAFLRDHGDRPFIIFGFTFMVWRYLFRELESEGVDLSRGILVHSGGWKRMLEEAVDNAEFKRRLGETTGLARIYNFYGMVEQVGSIFLEGEDGYLYPPSFADVIVRDPESWQEAPVGVPGVIQVVSVLPSSYPGHSILTEDLGVVHAVDDPAADRLGKAFSVLGRVPKTELRGCSDVHAFGESAA